MELAQTDPELERDIGEYPHPVSLKPSLHRREAGKKRQHR